MATAIIRLKTVAVEDVMIIYDIVWILSVEKVVLTKRTNNKQIDCLRRKKDNKVGH
jgi:hypothetical protein